MDFLDGSELCGNKEWNVNACTCSRFYCHAKTLSIDILCMTQMQRSLICNSQFQKRSCDGSLLSYDWKLKCPSFQNAQRHNAQDNILPKDFMPNMTICPRRHFAKRFYAQDDNLPKEDIMPKMTFCPYF